MAKKLGRPHKEPTITFGSSVSTSIIAETLEYERRVNTPKSFVEQVSQTRIGATPASRVTPGLDLSKQNMEKGKNIAEHSEPSTGGTNRAINYYSGQLGASKENTTPADTQNKDSLPKIAEEE
ncbi:hypothetical protein P3S67_022661 [Capsicum chacoense]